MKVLFVITRSDTIGGAQVHVRDLALSLNSFGYQTHIVTSGSGPYTDMLDSAELSYTSIKSMSREVSVFNDFISWWQLYKVIKSCQPDLVSTHSVKAGVLGRVVARLLRVPVIFTAHGWSHIRESTLTKKRLYCLIECLLSNLPRSKVVTVSEADYVYADEVIGIKKNRLINIWNGMPDVEPMAPMKKGLRQKIVCVARFQAPKDHRTICDALKLLLNYDWEIEFVGDGPLTGEIISYSEKLGIRKYCTFRGARNDVSEILRTADIFLLSSTSEGLPRSIIEALRAGLPVIASDVGGISEQVIDGENGWLFAPKDAPNLARKLEHLFKNEHERQRMSISSRKLYEDRFRFSSMLEKTLGVYRSM